MTIRLPVKATLALIVSVLLAGAAGAVGAGRSREFAGFYQVGKVVRTERTAEAGGSDLTDDTFRVVLHLKVFNFSDHDVMDGTLRVADTSTRVTLTRRESVQLALELPASGAELDRWVLGEAPPVSITLDGDAAMQAVSMIPMRVAVDAALSGERRMSRTAPALTGSAAMPDVTTVAGGGPSHVPATSAALGLPYHLAIDPHGNLHIADIQKIRIFRVDPDGELTVTAGTGKGSNLDSNGDGGNAVDAIFGRFSGLAAGPDGEIVSFEWGYHFGPDETEGHIRRVDPVTGRINSVLTGYPFSCPSFNPYMAGGVYDLTGSLLFIDQGCGFVWRIDSVTGQPEIIAGDGGFGFSGDDGPATSASLNYPSALAIDAHGNLYIGDAGNYRIRKVDAVTGTISTVAGNGSPGDGGDGGPALDASLRVSSLTVDPAGNIHFTDTEANRVRRIDAATGVIAASAGTGEFGFSGDGGPAVGATLAFPFGVVADAAGNLFIADLDNSRVRRVDAVTGIISTIAGGGDFLVGDGRPALDAELRSPSRIAVNAADDLFITTIGDGRIRRVDPVTGLIGTVTMTPVPVDVTVRAAGDLLFIEAANGQEPARVRRVDPVTGEVTTVAGGGSGGDGVPALETNLESPSAIMLDDAGNLYIAEQPAGPVSGRIRRVDAGTGTIMTIAGGASQDPGDGTLATEAWLDAPAGMALDATGSLYVTEELGCRIRRVDALTGVISTVAGSSSGTLDGNTGDGGLATDAGLAHPSDIVMNARGDLFVSTGTFRWNGQYTGRVRRIDSATGMIDTVAEAIGPISGLAADRRGNVYFVDNENFKVRRINLTNRKPLAVARAAAVAECGAPLMLDGSASQDADSTYGTHDDIVSYEWYEGYGTASETALGTGEQLSVSLPPGEHEITLVVGDSQGEKSTDALTVDVRDTLAPTLSITLDRSVLTPPNHRMVIVRATVSAADQCGTATFTLKSITSNEPADARGKADGKTPRDIAKAAPGTADTSFQLRAERSTAGTGRIYTIVYEATDAAGNTATATAVVTVPL